jgi:rhamnulose-1-phosphate aldolase/alcohol dehydrogenase
MSLSQDAVLGTGQDIVSAAAGGLKKPANRWDETAAATLDEAGQLLYRSNLLGADLSVTNFGGGNTSAKLMDIDPLTRQPVEVLWVKGSGGDLGSMGRDGFATLYLDRVRGLENLYRGRAFEDEMVGFLPHCTFALNPRPASIDTPLHAFIPYAHVDHLHPDAVVAIAATHESETLTREIFGGEVGWIAWQRPGFDLGLRIGEAVRAHPNWKGLVLEGHGLFSWGATARECYDVSIDLIGRAADAVNARLRPVAPRPMPAKATLRGIVERLRPLVSSVRPKLCELLSDDDMRSFVASPDILADAGQGAACPDHFLRTKPWPLVLEPGPLLGEGADVYVRDAVAAYRQRYRGYYERCRHDDSPALRDPDPVVVLVRDTCVLAFAADRTGARIAGEYARNALSVIAGARALGTYKALDEQEMFDIEYWRLEEAKLKRQPAPKRFAGQVAVITGGAGGIGRAVAAQILSEDGCVMLTDIDAVRLESVKADLSKRFSADRVRAFAADVADEAAVEASTEACILNFGGVDILVANAGIASAAPVSETSLDLWQSNFRVLSEGYFLPAREAFKVMRAMGGSIVFVASKNALAASANTSAYSSAKAAELQLARCLALEGAPYGIRVNVVNPDAVLKGSTIWTGEWRAQRAAAYNLREDELDDFYRQRSLLKRSVLPEDVAEAVVFLAGPGAAKSTGNILNVDAGNAAAFTR